MSLKTCNLSKKYGHDFALRNISLEIFRGKIFGVLGPNAAGKTTLLKLFASLLTPTEGYVKVLGFNSKKDRKNIHRIIGYLSHDLLLYRDLTGIENIQFYSRFYPTPSEGWQKRIDKLLNSLQIENWCYELIKNLSSGLQKRFDIARVFLHDPKVLLLDEPFSDLDLESQNVISELICRMQEDKIIVLSTHNLDQAKSLCDKTAVLLDGKLIRTLDKKKLQGIEPSKLFRKIN